MYKVNTYDSFLQFCEKCVIKVQFNHCYIYTKLMLQASVARCATFEYRDATFECMYSLPIMSKT